MKGRPFLLLALFLLFFALPIVGALSFFKLQDKEHLDHEGDPFPAALQFARKDSHISLPNAPALNIAENDRVLFVSWFKLRKLPREGEKLFLFSKLDSNSKNLSGYVVALTKRGEAIRPTVYWKDEKGKGGWYLFSEIELMLGEWVMLAVSFYDNRILGAYSAVYRSGQLGKLIVAGGVDLEESIVPQTQAKFIIGSVEGTQFKGKVGPFCLFNFQDYAVLDLLKEILNSPWNLPESVDRSSLRFCSYDLKVDMSPYNHPINYVVGTGSDSEE